MSGQTGPDGPAPGLRPGLWPWVQLALGLVLVGIGLATQIEQAEHKRANVHP